MSHRVVRAGLEHLELLTSLFDDYRQFYEHASDPDGAGWFLRARLERGEAVMYLALEGGRAAGFTQLYPSFTSVSLRRLWILNDLFVAPDARGRGVGQALLEVAAAFAKSSGAKGLVLTTATDNGPAQRLYERAGWRRDHAFYTYTLEV